MWFVSARKASLKSISHVTRPQLICPFKDVKLPNSSKITEQQLPELNHQYNPEISNHNNNTSKIQVFTYNDLTSHTSNIAVFKNNTVTNLQDNNLQSAAINLSKSIT